MSEPEGISKDQYDEATYICCKLSCMLHEMLPNEAPVAEGIEYIKRVINRMHFLLFDTSAPAMSFELYQGLCHHFFTCNLPTLILPHLGRVGFEEKNKYTTMVKKGILALSEFGYIKAYIDHTTYVDDLWVRLSLPAYKTYCGDILIALVEQPSVREIMIKKADVMQLLKLLESDSWQVQKECFRALQKRFSTAGGEQLPNNKAEIVTDKILNLTFNNAHIRVKCTAIETLAALVHTHSQIRTNYLPKYKYTSFIFATFFHAGSPLGKAALAFLSVYCKNDEPLPNLTQKQRSAILDTVRWFMENGYSGRLYCPLHQIYAYVSTGWQS